ncbi:hypothetical protein A3C96_00425, partial [Candidatus Uhrbacteria bacterium RIFCSPHIGHO2_02_FULL_60_10]
MMQYVLLFAGSLALVIWGATLATRASARLAESFRLSKYVVGFVIVAFISILPETLISISSAIGGVPAFGLGTLFGSNVADLSLIFAILIIAAGRGLKIESRILKNVSTYPFFLLIPLILGLDGRYSRLEGVALIVAGAIFYYSVFKNGVDASAALRNGYDGRFRSVLLLLASMFLLLVGAHLTVSSGTSLARALGVDPILIGLLVVGLGTTMPELFYSLKALARKDDGLAVGDILGSVLADATVVVGIVALISPF